MFLELEAVFNNEGFSLPFSYEQDLSGEVVHAQNPFVGPMQVTGAVTNETGVVMLRATLTVVMQLACDRCAQAIKRSMQFGLNLVLVTSVNEQEMDDMLLIDSMHFDLASLAREELFLQLPHKFLCKEDCKGLCPGCGQNLNHKTCSCKKQIDPRLAVLQQLLDDTSSD